MDFPKPNLREDSDGGSTTNPDVSTFPNPPPPNKIQVDTPTTTRDQEVVHRKGVPRTTVLSVEGVYPPLLLPICVHVGSTFCGRKILD